MIITLLFAFLSFVFIFHWILNKNSAIRNWPVLGMIPALIQNRNGIHDFFTQALEKGNDTFLFKGPWFSNLIFLCTSDSRNMQYILSKKFNNFQRGPDFKEIFEPLGNGIFNSDNEQWKTQQKSLHSLMKHKRYELAVQRILKEKLERGLFPILEKFSASGSVLDVQDVLQRFTFDSICQIILGFDPTCLSVDFPDVAYEKAYDKMEEVALRRHFVPKGIWKLEKWLQIGEEKELKKAWECFDNFLFAKISSIREKMNKKSNSGESFDLLTALLEENSKKSDVFLRDTAFNLLAAGRDTVAAALVWFLWLVATHPSVEENILEEIKANSNGENEDKKLKIFTAEELSKLVYLHGAVSEALRLYPPVPLEHRAAVEPDVLPSGHRVGKNEKIYLFVYAMGRSQKLWGEDCLEFKPERWISEQGGVVHVPSCIFMPFLTGPRTCLGKDTAFYQIKSIGLAIIQNYHVKVVENHPIVPSHAIVLKMKHGLHVKLSKRLHY